VVFTLCVSMTAALPEEDGRVAVTLRLAVMTGWASVAEGA
jgi:hypothetical protein